MDTSSGRSQWSIVVMLMVFAGLAHFNRIAIAVAGAEVFIPKSGISEAQMGWVYTAFLIVYTIGMLPAGWFIDRIGSARALVVLGVGMGTFTGLTGILGFVTLAPLQLWTGLLVIRSIAGLWNTPLHPGAAHVVSEAMPPGRRATANGMVTAGALIGIAFCYPVFGVMIDYLSWPVAFLFGGAALFGFGVVWHQRVSKQMTSNVQHAETNAPFKLSILFRRDLWLLSFSYMAFGYFQYLFFYWMEHYLKDILHVDKISARTDSFWITLAQGAGMAIGGLCTDIMCRLVGVRWGRRAIVMTGMCLGAVAALVAVSVRSESEVVLALCVSMGALGLCEGVFWTTATDIGGRNRGLFAAFMNTFGNGGGLVSPVLTPILAQSSLGWSGAITVACAIAAVGGLVWWWINPHQEDTLRVTSSVG